MNIVRIDVPNPDEILIGYAPAPVVQVQRSATGGTGYSQIGTVAIAAGQLEYVYYDATGATTDWYRTRYAPASGGTPPSEWSAEHQINQPSLLSISAVRALVDTNMDDDDLQDIINREETELASIIGPLTGARTETYYPEARQPLYLSRPTNAVVVTDVGTTVPSGTILLLAGGTRVTRYRSAQTSVAGAYWIGPVTITYTPNDSAKVTRVLIELVRLTLIETGYEQERIGDYSYSLRGSGTSTESRRRRLIATLRARRGPFTIRVDSATARPAVWIANVGWDHEL